MPPDDRYDKLARELYYRIRPLFGDFTDEVRDVLRREFAQAIERAAVVGGITALEGLYGPTWDHPNLSALRKRLEELGK